MGGRAPAGRWGSGSLQELDHPPIFQTITKSATTAHTVDSIAPTVDAAFAAAGSSHRGPTFVDVPMDELFGQATIGSTPHTVVAPIQPDPDDLSAISRVLAGATQPVLIIGTDVWADRAEEAALRFVEETGIPVISNGMGRGIVPGGHPQLVTKARSAALNGADVVVVVGTPLDFRLGYGIFGGKEGLDAREGRPHRRLPRPGRAARDAGRVGRRRSLVLLRRHPRRPDRRRKTRLDPLAHRPAGTGCRSHAAVTTNC